MIVTGDTSTTAEREAGQHRAARRALTGWKLHRVGGRRRAGVPAAAAPACSECPRPARGVVPTDERAPGHFCRQCADHCQIAAHIAAERAERFHTYGITR